MTLSIMEVKKQFEAADKDKSGSVSPAGILFLFLHFSPSFPSSFLLLLFF